MDQDIKLTYIIKGIEHHSILSGWMFDTLDQASQWFSRKYDIAVISAVYV